MSATTSRTPDWFLREIVEPTMDEFLLHRDCLRRGMLAALVVSSLADHISVAQSMESGVLSRYSPGTTLPKREQEKLFNELAAFRKQLTRCSSDFALVRDVADATKHARLDRSDAKMKDVSGVQHHVEVLVDNNGRSIADGRGRDLAISGVAVMLPDGSRHRLAKLLSGAITFLEGEIRH